MKETPIKPNSRKATKYRGVSCLNCGHPLDLSDRYCSYCGQLNTTKRLVLKDFFLEFLQSIFTYDSRFRFTLKDLLVKPGTITKNYVEGKRFSYANPFRFFLSLSIAYFIAVAIVGFFKDTENVINPNFLFMNSDTPIEIVSNNPEVAAVLDSIQTQPELQNTPLDSLINAQIANTEAIVDTSYTYIPEKDLDSLFVLERISKKFELFRDFRKYTEISNAARGLDSLHYEKDRWNIWVYDRSNLPERIQENPIKFATFLTSKTPFFLFFFAPFFALFFWLIYSKKKYNYMEHLIFIFHIFSWVFLVLLIVLPIDLLIPRENIIAKTVLLLIGPFYFYKALRNFYKQNRVFTIIKFVFLNVVFFIATTIFATMFFLVAATFF